MNIHEETLWYTFSPFSRLLGSRLVTPVPFRPHTSTGLNQNWACLLEQVVSLTPPAVELSFEPEQ